MFYSGCIYEPPKSNLCPQTPNIMIFDIWIDESMFFEYVSPHRIYNIIWSAKETNQQSQTTHKSYFKKRLV